MNIESLLRYIKNDVNELIEIVGDLTPGREMTEIDIKLIHSRVRSISEEFEMLENGLKNEAPAHDEKKDEKAKPISGDANEIASEEPDEKIVTEAPPQESKTKEIDYQEEDNKVNPEPAPEEAPTDINEEIEDEIQEVVEKPEPLTEEEPRKTIADKYTGAKNSINERIAIHFDQKDLASKLQQHPIEDLTKAIKLNDKIWFINDLFEGNADLYRDTVRKLNKMDDLESALLFLEQNFDFEQEKESFKTFIEFIYRRYLK